MTKNGKAALVLASAVALTMLASASTSGAGARFRVVAGIGVWNQQGRVHTLEMVGLNPQPEPPSRPVALVYVPTGSRPVAISLSCARTPDSRTFIGTGKGSNGRWYRIKIVDVGLPGGRGRDVVGVTSQLFPPNPCSEPGVASAIAAGDFIVR